MLDNATQNLIALMGIYALMAASLAIVNGVAGQFSLGHAAFQSVGAYASALAFALVFADASGEVASVASTRGWLGAWLAIGLGGIVAAATGWVVALPCLRLRGDYLAIATLGFNEILGVLIRAQGPIGRVDPGGPRGFNDIPRGLAAGTPAIFLVLVLVMIAFWRLLRSRRGRAFEAIREDEVAAEAVGIDGTRTKVLAFVLAAGVAGLAGGLYAFHFGSISDRAFDVAHSIDYVVMVLLGGGRPLGAAAAAVVLTLVNDQFRGLDTQRMVAYGFFLVWLMVSRTPALAGRLRWPISPFVNAKPTPAATGSDLDELPHNPERGVESRPLLVCRGITARFGGLTAVEGLDLEVASGECVGLIGPNGAGKSTVFNLISGVYRPTTGSIALEGRRVDGVRPHRVVLAGLGRTFQNIRLFDGMTVLDNLRAATLGRIPVPLASAILGRDGGVNVDRECLGLLRRFGLADRYGWRARDLSYGDRRRLEIARALATRPTILLLDEPAAGLNPSEKRDLRDQLNALLTGTDRLALLIVEHDMPFLLGLCDRLVVLEQGRKIADGPPDLVRADPLVIEAYLGSEDEA